MAATYAKYLKLGELLALQTPVSDGPEHDETLFIIIHQVYELWFKEMLHEIDYLVTLLDRGEVARALHTLKRVLTILKVVVAQVDVLETMTPLEFLSFRHRLDAASGLQSYQFRELELASKLEVVGAPTTNELRNETVVLRLTGPRQGVWLLRLSPEWSRARPRAVVPPGMRLETLRMDEEPC